MPSVFSSTTRYFEIPDSLLGRETLAVVRLSQAATPAWLLDKNILDKFSDPSTGNNVGNLQLRILKELLLPTRLLKMVNTTQRFGDNAYTVAEMLNDTENGIWSELAYGGRISRGGISGKAIEPLRRDLQKAYISALDSLLNGSSAGLPAGAAESDIASLARALNPKPQA